MMYAFPFESDRFEMAMDARAGVSSLIEVEPDKYHAQIALKQDILASDPNAYYICPPNAEPLAWEALELLLPDMARNLPDYFGLDTQGRRWTWTNRLLGRTTTFDLDEPATLPTAPLDWLGRQVQEDLILMAAGDTGESVCVGGHLCFSSGWSLGDQIGRTFGQIHGEVPHFAERLGRPADLLMRRLKPNRPVERLNWTVHATDQLNLTPMRAEEWRRSRAEVTPGNAGDRCFLRLERQTLSRLPRTGGVLFTIHTYLHPMSEVAAEPGRARRLAAVLRDMPAATRAYKGLTSYIDPLLAYLDARAAEDAH
jgi:hypothetical protein